MMRQLIRSRSLTHPLMLVLAVIILAAAACGGQQSAGPAVSAAAPASGAAKAPGSTPAGAAAKTVAGASKSQTVTFGVNSKTAASWPLLVAVAKGFLGQNGITLDVIQTGSSAGLAQQLAAGSLSMGETGFPDLVRPINAGAPIRIIAAEATTPPYSLVAKPTIKQWSDLKGKTVMIGASKDVVRVFWDKMSQANGLTPNDYDLAYAGSTNARFAALHSGAVDATYLNPPFDVRAQGEGFTVLATVQEYFKDFPFTGYAANTNWLKGNQPAAVAFLKGYMAALAWLYDPGNQDEAVQILGKETNTETADALKTYGLLVGKLKIWPQDGQVPDAGMQTLLKALVDLGDMDLPLPPTSKFIDDSVLKLARQSA